MIERVLNLNQRTVSSIMTSRHDIEHIDLTASEEHIRALLDKTSTPAWLSPAVKRKRSCWAWCTSSTCCNSSCTVKHLICVPRYASRWSSLRDCSCFLLLSSSVTRALTLPLWWMNSVPLKDWSRSATSWKPSPVICPTRWMRLMRATTSRKMPTGRGRRTAICRWKTGAICAATAG